MEWETDTPDGRARLYEIVLREGNIDDVCELVNGAAMVNLWDQLFLPPWLREAWALLVELTRRDREESR